MATPVYAFADRYIEETAALNPQVASMWGIAGHDHELNDPSPSGIEARAAHSRSALAELRSLPVTCEADRICQRYLDDRLSASIALDDAEEGYAMLRILGSPVQGLRSWFDNARRATAEDWENVAARLEAVPAASLGARATLEEGLRRGKVSARRQVDAVVDQLETWSGDRPFFPPRVAEAGSVDGVDGDLLGRLEAAAAAATQAFGDLARWLREGYRPSAAERDAVGEERYLLHAAATLHDRLDLDDAYGWAWDELARIEAEMERTCAEILPGASIEETMASLDADEARMVHGEDALLGFLQDLMDRTIDELDGTHFDIAPALRKVEAMIAPPGSAAAPYYTPPTEDFRRPGRTWYPTRGLTSFPVWGEVSTWYHEGVPGHHLQIAQCVHNAAELSRVQRLTHTSGHAEGWALYAERLMDELGAYEGRPDLRLGFLRCQAMRAVRVIVDIGMHTERAIPAASSFHPGEVWTPEIGEAFLFERARFPRDFMASELVRYLGLPSQAICYKLGERVWLEARDTVRRRLGDGFDLKAFHTRALDLGPLGLAQLRDELV